MKRAAALVAFVFAASLLAQTDTARPVGTPSNVDIVEGPTPPVIPLPPPGYSLETWIVYDKSKPGDIGTQWYGWRKVGTPATNASGTKRNSRPKHKTPTNCEKRAAKYYIDHEADAINDGLKAVAHRTFDNDQVAEAMKAIDGQTSLSDSEWDRISAGRKKDFTSTTAGFYDPDNGGIYTKSSKLQDATPAQTAGVLAHEAMHKMIANSTLVPALAYPPDDGWEDKFIYDYIAKHPPEADCAGD